MAARETPDAVAPSAEPAAPAQAGYQYDVVLGRRAGPPWRWHGRVVTTSPDGERHYWRPRSSMSRHRLLAALWEEAMLDIQWRTGHGAVRVIEARS